VSVFKNKIAIIVGAGAVENAWEPILQIVKPIIQGEVPDPDIANCLFARRIYVLRAYSSFSDDKSLENLNNEKELISELKSLIGDLIKRYQHKGFLKARKEFKDILTKFVFTDPNNMFGLVSTNWDTVIDMEADRIVKQVYLDLKNAKCFHIHGSIDTPEYLYLPTETSQERYRTKEDNERHGLNHYLTLKFLKEANQIILYGISLDPLDAELSQILNSTFTTNNNLRNLVIVNPDFKRVRNRVKALLFPKKDIVIKCFVPDNLEQEV
jgi:hypothetical protein